jgi:hypothetical protein
MMTRDEYERLMRNWVRWHDSGGGDCSISGVYSGMVFDDRETRLSVSEGEASDIFRFVLALRQELREAIYAHWLRKGIDGHWLGSIPEDRIARRLGCADSTYRRRLELARNAICSAWHDRKTSIQLSIARAEP